MGTRFGGKLTGENTDISSEVTDARDADGPRPGNHMDEEVGIGRIATAVVEGVIGGADACGGVLVLCEIDSSCFENIADKAYVARSLGGLVPGSEVVSGAVCESESCGTGSFAGFM